MPNAHPLTFALASSIRRHLEVAARALARAPKISEHESVRHCYYAILPPIVPAETTICLAIIIVRCHTTETGSDHEAHCKRKNLHHLHPRRRQAIRWQNKKPRFPLFRSCKPAADRETRNSRVAARLGPRW